LHVQRATKAEHASIASGPAIPTINAAAPMFAGLPEITIAKPNFVNANNRGVRLGVFRWVRGERFLRW